MSEPGSMRGGSAAAKSITSARADGETQTQTQAAAGKKESDSVAKCIIPTRTRADGNPQAPIGTPSSSFSASQPAAAAAAVPTSAPNQNQNRIRVPEAPEATGNTTMQEGSYDFLGDLGTNAEDLQKCFARYEAAIKDFPPKKTGYIPPRTTSSIPLRTMSSIPPRTTSSIPPYATRSAPAPPRGREGWVQYGSHTRVSPQVARRMEEISARGGLYGSGHAYGGEGSQGHSGGSRKVSWRR